MATITISGASDDLIEIDGDLREEFMYYADADEAAGLITVGDGSALRISLDDDGFWRITTIVTGSAQATKTEAHSDDDYSDQVTLTGDLRWVHVGHELHRIGDTVVADRG